LTIDPYEMNNMINAEEYQSMILEMQADMQNERERNVSFGN